MVKIKLNLLDFLKIFLYQIRIDIHGMIRIVSSFISIQHSPQ